MPGEPIGDAGSVPFSFKKIDEMDEVGAAAQLVGIAAPSANQWIALAELRQRWWHTTRLAAVTVPPASARNRTGTPSRQKGQNRRRSELPEAGHKTHASVNAASLTRSRSDHLADRPREPSRSRKSRLDVRFH